MKCCDGIFLCCIQHKGSLAKAVLWIVWWNKSEIRKERMYDGIIPCIHECPFLCHLVKLLMALCGVSFNFIFRSWFWQILRWRIFKPLFYIHIIDLFETWQVCASEVLHICQILNKIPLWAVTPSFSLHLTYRVSVTIFSCYENGHSLFL